MESNQSRLNYLQEEIDQERRDLGYFEEECDSFIRKIRQDSEMTSRISQAGGGPDVNTLISLLEQENQDYEKECREKIDRQREDKLDEIRYKLRSLELLKEQVKEED